MKRLVGLATLLVCAALLGPASASAIIQIDRGMAGARIGNTKAQVRTALGQPKRVRNGTNEFGNFTEFVYAGKIRVTFQGGNNVTAVTTTGLGDRTARGVGVRSTLAAVRNRVPGVSCDPIPGGRICQTGTGQPGERITAFFVRNGRVNRVVVGIVID
jgi:hypothetical protein